MRLDTDLLPPKSAFVEEKADIVTVCRCKLKSQNNDDIMNPRKLVEI
jgi:hypothetical protein